MLQSHVVELGGTFVGAAITTTAGFRFRAIDVRVEELDESTWRSLEELTSAVRHLFHTGRLKSSGQPAGLDVLRHAARPAPFASVTG